MDHETAMTHAPEGGAAMPAEAPLLIWELHDVRFSAVRAGLVVMEVTCGRHVTADVVLSRDHVRDLAECLHEWAALDADRAGAEEEG